MKTIFSLFIAVSAFFFVSCAQQSTAPEGVISEKMAPKEFMDKFEATEGAILVDVRTPEEVANGTIEGALNIDFSSPNFKEEMGKLDKNAPIFVFCAAGGRSGRCAGMMEKSGFKEIYDMKGGYSAYSK